ncbi:ABC transporter substrate-binding protein [Brucellaceae bacterium C25G]
MRFAKLVGMTALAVISVAGYGAQALAEPFRMIITDMETPLVPNSVVDLALKGGYFERAGVDVELIRVQQTPMALAALQSNEGDMANIATEALVQLVARGTTNLRAVTSPNKALPYLIAAKEGVTSIDDINGKSFGIGRIGSLDHSLSSKVLASKGIDTEKLSWVALGQPNIRAQALKAGQIDATTMSIGALLALPGHETLPVLVNVDDYFAAAPVTSKVNAVTVDTLEKRGDDIEKVIEALTLAARDFAEKPENWASAMKEARSDVKPESLDELAKAFANSWSVNGGIQKSELAFTQDWLYQTEEFEGLRPVALEEWVDFGPADAVLKKIGVYDGLDEVSR